MKRVLAVVSAAAMLVLPGRLLAHEGHKVMGTVTAVDASRIEVEDKDGKKVSIALTTDTKYMKLGATAGTRAKAVAADVMVRQRVVVAVAEEGDKMTAKEVMLGAAEKSHPHDKPHEHQH